MHYSTSVDSDLASLKQRFEILADLSQIDGLLAWDRHTYLPPMSGPTRGRQSATLASLMHEKLADPTIGEWLARLEEAPLTADDARLVELCRWKHERAVRVPGRLVEALSVKRSEAQEEWAAARRENDFTRFAPAMQAVFELRREEAEHIGYDEHPYDALHDEYEPGSTAARVRRLFDQLRPALVRLAERAGATVQPERDSLLRREYDEALQERFVRTEVERFGYDFARGRLDPTVHPFAQAIGRDDVRITTRYKRDYLATGVFATFHEAGHALYEQGLSEEHERSPLGQAIGLGLHESQSRLWENLVGRSLPYWRGSYHRLQSLFPDQLSGVDADEFYRSVNTVSPSFIRVEADEVTYNLHVIVRFELELALLEGDLKAADLREAWNTRYKELLGITPPDDLRGCLQDVHWSLGLIGYFPTYTLGNLMSVQLFEAAQAALPGLDESVEAGEFAGLLGWLRQQVHMQGSRYQPDALLARVTGSPLDAGPYLRYLDRKFAALYGLAVSS